MNGFEKDLVQVFFYENGLYIINKTNCDYILKIFVDNFKFTILEGNKFWENLKYTEKEEIHFLNDINYTTILKQNNEKTLQRKNSKKNTVNNNLPSYDFNLLNNHSIISSLGESKEGKIF